MAADDYDVIVIGGGPAGATTATLLAMKRRRVLLIEKERFPRFRIGESLMPQTYWTFERLGMLPKLRAGDFPRKYSVQFVSGSGKESQPFYFNQFNPHECSVTWQVLRSRFDRMMLDNAVEHGATVLQGCRVRDVIKNDGRVVGVIAAPSDERPAAVMRASVVVDATGQGALLSRRFDLRRPDPTLRKASVFAHYKGGHRDRGIDEGATLVLRLPDPQGWFWYIPLPDDVVSVGVVASPEYLFADGSGDPAATLDRLIDVCPAVKRRLGRARRITTVQVCSDFSYRATHCAGDGWVLVGDAFGFLDPIYSSGVFLALKSGEMAADAIDDALAVGDLTGRKLGRWGPELSAGMEAVRKLVHAFYTPGFRFGRFIRENPEQRKNLVALLVGDLFRPEVNEIFELIGRECALPEPAQPVMPSERAPS